MPDIYIKLGVVIIGIIGALFYGWLLATLIGNALDDIDKKDK